MTELVIKVVLLDSTKRVYNSWNFLDHLELAKDIKMLNCENNKLILLPNSLGNCTNLEILYCYYNNFTSRFTW